MRCLGDPPQENGASVVSIFTGVISSIIAYIQLNIVMLRYHDDYEIDMLALIMLLQNHGQGFYFSLLVRGVFGFIRN